LKGATSFLLASFVLVSAAPLAASSSGHVDMVFTRAMRSVTWRWVIVSAATATDLASSSSLRAVSACSGSVSPYRVVRRARCSAACASMVVALAPAFATITSKWPRVLTFSSTKFRAGSRLRLEVSSGWEPEARA
jgi:hypothetical protein